VDAADAGSDAQGVTEMTLGSIDAAAAVIVATTGSPEKKKQKRDKYNNNNNKEKQRQHGPLIERYIGSAWWSAKQHLPNAQLPEICFRTDRI